MTTGLEPVPGVPDDAFAPVAGLCAVRGALGGGLRAAAPFGMLHSQVGSER